MSSFTASALVTGGTVNLGYHAALTIAKQHPEWLVVISSRTDKEHAADQINKTLGQNNVIFTPLDLASLDNVRKYGADWTAANRPPIKALVLNAGLQFPGGMEKTGDGIEKTFAINHLGHALLFHLLWPHLAPNARIAVTSSGTHDPAQKSGLPDAIYDSAELLAHPSQETAKYEGRQRYSTSKLTNVLWTYAADRRLKQYAPEKHITINAFDPGLMPGTGLAREYNAVMRFVWNSILPRLIGFLRVVFNPNVHTARESGAALARLAVGDDIEGVSGKYYEGLKEIPSSKDSYVEAKQEDLWKWSVEHLANGDKETEKKWNELK